MTTSGQSLRCLLVEDMEDDAKLVLRALRKGGYAVTWERVETAETMRAALLGKSWDLVLSDYQMPNFSGIRALELLHTTGLDLPFIIVSGTIGERTAVDCMKAGAHDYLMKDALARLVPAIKRELREADDRRMRRAAEESLRSNERRLRSFFESSNVGMSITQLSGHVQVNRALCEMLGYSAAEFAHLTWQAVTHPDDLAITQAEINALISGNKSSTRLIKRYLHKNGSVVWGDLSTALHRDEAGQPAYLITAIVDITERKQIERVDVFLAQAGSSLEGEPFFATLARFLAENLQMDYICIDRLEGDALSATTLAVWHDGNFEDNVTYALKDTPCGEVVDKRVCCYPAHVSRSFPKDPALQQLQAESYIGTTLFDHRGRPIGLIAVIGRHPLNNRALAEAVLARVAPRAAGELERLTAEAQLQRSEERYRMITENASDLIWLYDLATGKFDYISPSVERLLGYTREELQTVELTAVLTPASAAEARATLGRRLAALANGDLSHLQHVGRYDHVRKDGSIMIGEVTSVALLDQAGQPIKILGVARDITERERSHAAVEASEMRFRTIFEQAGVGVALVGLDGKWMDVNDRLCQILRYPREELLQRTFQDITYAEDLESDLELVRQTIAGEIPGYTMEKRYMRRDGLIAWALLTVSLVRSADGQALHFISVIEDLTARKEAELALRTTEHRFKRFMDQIPGLAYIKDANGRTLFANQGFAALLGLRMEDVIGKRSTDFFSADFAAKIDAEDQEILAKGAPKELEEYFGGRTWMTTKFPITLEGSGSLLGGITLDVTERKKAEQDLEESEARFRILSDHALLGVYIVKDGILNYVNPALAGVFGYAREELIGADPLFLIHPDDRALVSENMRRHLSGEIKSLQYQFKGIRKDGEVRRIEVLGAGAIMNGRPVIIGNILDITERERAETALRAREEIFSSIVNQAGDAIGLVDPATGRFVEFNRAAHENLGYTREEFAVLTIADLEANQSSEQVRENLAVVMARGRAVFETLHRHRDGSVRDVRVSACRVHLHQRDCITALWSDITEIKRAQVELQHLAEELRARNEALTRFNVAAVGRELRMIELKRELNELSSRLGEAPRFRVPDRAVPSDPAKETSP